MMEQSDVHPTEPNLLQALIALHRGLERQGPGDEDFSRQILAALPALPTPPRIADLGCGAGAGALLLAKHFGSRVIAVDSSADFLAQLRQRAEATGVAGLIETVEADIGALGWPPALLDLLWSEGAAYVLTFADALRCWRPLLVPGGVAVVSELSWFTDAPPVPLREYWQKEYPHIGSEADNVRRAEAAGFEVFGLQRLPSRAWWDNYYGPLERRIAAVAPSADAAMREVIRLTRSEMEMLRRYGAHYGYSFYLLRAV